MARTTAKPAAAPSLATGEAGGTGAELDAAQLEKAAADKAAADELALKEAADKAAADELAAKEAEAKAKADDELKAAEEKAAADKAAADLVAKEAFDKKVADDLAQKDADDKAKAAAQAAAEANPTFPVVLSVTNAQPCSFHVSGTDETLSPGETRDVEFTEKAFKRFESTVEQLAELREWKRGEGVIVEGVA